MGKREKDTITIGSAKAYMMVVTDAMPSKDDLFKEENHVGHIKGGAAIEYTEETHEEKDDLGLVSKVITVSEEAIMKMGLITWNGETLKYLADRCKVTTTTSGTRTIHIGGAGNSQGKEWVLCFFHEDKKDGNLWVMIRGRNNAGLTLTLAADAGTVMEPEFKALPQDDAGTLITIIEETTTT